MAENFLIMGVVLSAAAIVVYYFFKKDDAREEDNEEDEFSVEYLRDGIKDKINLLTDTSRADQYLSREAAKKEVAGKLQLIRAVRTCGHGDLNAKLFVKDYIRMLLQRDFLISETTIDKVIPFDQEAMLTVTDKFDILLYLYVKDYGLDALYHMITKNGYHRLKGTGERDDEYRYEITAMEIESLYQSENTYLSYPDKLEIVTQRIYSRYLGNGVIDEIRDMRKLDGISAGLSGLRSEYYHYLEDYMAENREALGYYYNSIWIMFQGKTIHLSFLGFGSKAEMIRVAKKIYRYDEPGYLSEDRGYIINSMSDGSRIVVVRPKVSENWAFFIRKLNSIEDASIENLLTDQASDIPISIMRWLIKGCCTIAVTGKQFSGKTTLLKSMMEFINPQFNVRVQEMIFELHLKDIPRYRHRNVLTLRDTPSVSGQTVMDLFKKTDGDAYIFGEVHSPDACSLVVQGALMGTRQLLFSHHAKSTEALVDSFKVALMQTGVFSLEMAAEEQVARAINFDFHMSTTLDGHIYLERITEILPDKRLVNEKRYRTRDIVAFKDGKYHLCGIPDPATRDRISEFLTKEEMANYDKFFRI